MAEQASRNFSDANAQPFFLKGGDQGILLIHGFTGSPSHMRPLGEELSRQGFTVSGIRLPGHGTTMEDMGKTTWQNWLQAAKEGYHALKAHCPFVCVAGLSMGGVLSLLLAEQLPVQAAVPISAPMGVKNPLAPFAAVASLVVPMTYWKIDPKRQAFLDQAYDYGYSGFPTAKAGDLLHLIRRARRDLFAINCPVLVVQSHADETIHPRSADIILNGVMSEKKEVLWLEEVPHVVTVTRECSRIAEAMGDFLRQTAAQTDAKKLTKTVDKPVEV